MAAQTETWNPEEVPDQTGKVFLVTGATAGLGYFAAEQLAASGAHVILSGRNPNRLQSARAAVQRRVPNASTESILLDVTKSGSVHSAAASLGARERLDGVLLNAGIVHPPEQREEVEGHELVLQTNVLGHFALAGDLLTLLAKTGVAYGATRIVWLGSVSVTSWNQPTFDAELRENYSIARAYVQSKLLAQALGAEADRRLRAAGLPVESVIAHPGYSLSGRSRSVPGVNAPKRIKRFLDNLQAPIAQSKETGAHAEVRALVDPAVASGDMVGPFSRLRGATRIFPRDRATAITRISRNESLGAEAWDVAEAATRVKWPIATLQAEAK